METACGPPTGPKRSPGPPMPLGRSGASDQTTLHAPPVAPTSADDPSQHTRPSRNASSDPPGVLSGGGRWAGTGGKTLQSEHFIFIAFEALPTCDPLGTSRHAPPARAQQTGMCGHSVIASSPSQAAYCSHVRLNDDVEMRACAVHVQINRRAEPASASACLPLLASTICSRPILDAYATVCPCYM